MASQCSALVKKESIRASLQHWKEMFENAVLAETNMNLEEKIDIEALKDDTEVRR